MRGAVMVASLGLAMGCRGPTPHAPPGKDATPDAAPGFDAIGALRTLATERLAALRAEGPTTLERGHVIPALGACTRPSPAEEAALAERVIAWIGRAGLGPLLEDEAPDLSFGCVEADGTVVDVQADLGRAAGTRAGYWWVMRIGSSIDVIAHVQGTALADAMEYADLASVATLALADLDHDGQLDLVLGRDHHEGGASPDLTVEVVSGTRTTAAGHHDDAIAATRFHDGDVAVLALQGSSRTYYRCVTVGQPWRDCPAAQAAARHDAAIAAATELGEHPAEGLSDRDALAATLALLEIPADRAAPLLAAATPTTVAGQVQAFVRARRAVRDARTAEEQAAITQAAEAELAADLRRLTDEPACPPITAAQRKTIEARFRRWFVQLNRRARFDGPIELLAGSCVAPTRALVHLGWRTATGDDLTAYEAVLILDGSPRALASNAAAAGFEGGSLSIDGDIEVRVKSYLRDGHIGAMIAGPSGKVDAAYDGQVIATRDDLDLVWRHGEPEGEGYLLDSLARSVDQERDQIGYWHVTATGFARVAGFSGDQASILGDPPAQAGTPIEQRLRSLEREASAAALLERVDDAVLADPAGRAACMEALRLAGADPALIARVKGTP